MDTPIVFIIFNRPDTAQKVFEQIKDIKPTSLFIIADAARPHRKGEEDLCVQTRSIINQVDWDCQVLTNFASSNMGCRDRISSGLDWVFSLVEEAIILEDDCYPNPSFFRFCGELLSYYRQDSRIMHIGGTNYQFGRKRFPYSYYFSRYNHCWGWATWRRAWQFYNHDMSLWPLFREQDRLKDIFQDDKAEKYWRRSFEKVYRRQLDSWSYCWTLSCWMQGGLTILPSVNLVSNIGFDASGSHTRNRMSRYSNMMAQEMDFPLNHPPFLVRDDKADRYTQDNNFRRSWIVEMASKLIHSR